MNARKIPEGEPGEIAEACRRGLGRDELRCSFSEAYALLTEMDGELNKPSDWRYQHAEYLESLGYGEGEIKLTGSKIPLRV